MKTNESRFIYSGGVYPVSADGVTPLGLREEVMK